MFMRLICSCSSLSAVLPLLAACRFDSFQVYAHNAQTSIYHLAIFNITTCIFFLHTLLRCCCCSTSMRHVIEDVKDMCQNNKLDFYGFLLVVLPLSYCGRTSCSFMGIVSISLILSDLLLSPSYLLPSNKFHSSHLQCACYLPQHKGRGSKRQGISICNLISLHFLTAFHHQLIFALITILSQHAERYWDVQSLK